MTPEEILKTIKIIGDKTEPMTNEQITQLIKKGYIDTETDRCLDPKTTKHEILKEAIRKCRKYRWITATTTPKTIPPFLICVDRECLIKAITEMKPIEGKR